MLEPTIMADGEQSHGDKSASVILAIHTEPLSDVDAVPVENEPFMKVIEGQGGKVAERIVFASSDGHMAIGVSEYDPFTLALENWPVDEFMHMIEGQVEILDVNGIGRVYGPGDSFVMPKGFSGIWRQLGPIRKIAIAYEPR